MGKSLSGSKSWARTDGLGDGQVETVTARNRRAFCTRYTQPDSRGKGPCLRIVREFHPDRSRSLSDPLILDGSESFSSDKAQFGVTYQRQYVKERAEAIR